MNSNRHSIEGCIAMAAFVVFSMVHAQTTYAADIVVGIPSGFTGPVAGPVKEMVAGAKLYIDAVNAQGGIHGNRIRLEVVDDAFDPKKTAEAAKALIDEKGAIALFLIRGTPNSQAVLPVIRATGTPLIAPSTGANVLHEPLDPLVFNVRSKYQVEAEKAILQLGMTGNNQIVIVHVDDSFGKDALIGFQSGMAKTKLKPVAIIVNDRAKPDIAAAVAKIVAIKPQAVVMAASAKQCADLIKAARNAGSLAQFVALSNVSSQAFVDDLGAFGHGIQVMQVFPNPDSISLPITRAFRKLAATVAGSTVSYAAMEGFVAANVLVEGLRRAGPNPTRKSLVSGLESIKDFDLGGLSIGYGPTDRTGVEFAEPSIINRSGKFVM